MSHPETLDITDDTLGPYSVQTPTEHAKYRLTVPTDLRRHLDLQTGDDLAVHISLGPDGTITLQYIPAVYAPDTAYTVSVSASQSTAVTRIPSATGQALGLDGTEDAYWSLRHDRAPADIDPDDVPDRFATPPSTGTAEDTSVTVPIFEVIITRNVGPITLSDAVPLDTEPLTRQVQEGMQRGEYTWDQEQFRYYLDSEKLNELGWRIDEEVALTIRHRGPTPTIVATPLRLVDTEPPSKLTATISGTGVKQVDGVISLPPALVRTLGFADVPLAWHSDDGRLIVTRSARTG